MINEQRSRPGRSRLAKKAPSHAVWAESDKKGGFLIFAGVKGTEIKTYVGSARSRSTLDYNLRKAKTKFGLPVD